MPKAHKPRSGSMQFWPRKRAKRQYPRIRSWASEKEAKPIGFAGYKVGMTHVMAIGKSKGKKAGEKVSIPATIIECPPLKVISVRMYKNAPEGTKAVSEIQADLSEKEAQIISRKIRISKKKKEKPKEEPDYDKISIMVSTQPRLISIGKKKPEIFEMAIGGSKEDQMKFGKDMLGKEIKIEDVINEGSYIDIHAVTKGKGFQGPLKRFGISKRSHKSEKTIRGPGSLGPWKGQTHIMYRIAHAGQMGYHTRTEYNKQVMKISQKPEEIKKKGGFDHYGIVKNSYMLVKGSVAGPSKRLIRFAISQRVRKNAQKEAPAITFVGI